jgi:hypothetical protein
MRPTPSPVDAAARCALRWIVGAPGGTLRGKPAHERAQGPGRRSVCCVCGRWARHRPGHAALDDGGGRDVHGGDTEPADGLQRQRHQGQFLCRAVSAELAAATISLKDLEAARNRRRRELRTELTSRRSLVDALRHPVREPVPADAVTTLEEPAGAASSTPKRTTKLKLYRED